MGYTKEFIEGNHKFETSTHSNLSLPPRKEHERFYHKENLNQQEFEELKDQMSKIKIKPIKK